MSDVARRLRHTAADLYDSKGETMKRWDEIRDQVERLRGSDLPRRIFESMIETWADLMIEAADALDAEQAASKDDH